jgi:hypothetical protein
MSSWLASIGMPVAAAGATGIIMNDKMSEYLERTLGQYIDADDVEIEKSKTFSEFLNYLDIKQISAEYIKNLVMDDIDYTFTISDNTLDAEYHTIYSNERKSIYISPNCEISNNEANNENSKEMLLDLFGIINQHTIRNVTFNISKELFVNALQNILLPLSNLISLFITNAVNLTIIVEGIPDSDIASEQVNESFKYLFKSFENINKLKISGLKLNNYDEIVKCINSIKTVEEIEIIDCNSYTIYPEENPIDFYDCLIPLNPTVKKLSWINTLTNLSINRYNALIDKMFLFNCKTLKISGVRGLNIVEPDGLINFIGEIGDISAIDIDSIDINFANFINILNLNKYEKISYFARHRVLFITEVNNQHLMTALNGCSKLKEFSIKIKVPPPGGADTVANSILNEQLLLILFNLSIEKIEVEIINNFSYGFDDNEWKNILKAIGSNNFIRKLKIANLFSSETTNFNDFISQNFEINEGLVELELINNSMLNDNLIINLDIQIKLLPNLKKLIINGNANVKKYINELNELTHVSINTATINESVGFIANFNAEFNSSIFSIETHTNVKSQKELCKNSLTVLEAYNIDNNLYKVLLFCNKIYSIVIHDALRDATDRTAEVEIKSIISPFFINNKSVIEIKWKNNSLFNRAAANSLINFYLKCNKIYLNFINETPSIDELVIYNIKSNKDKKYYTVNNYGMGLWNCVNISNYLKTALSKQQYMRYLNQTYDVVTYRLRWGGIYEDDNGVLWYQNGLDIPFQKYNKIVYSSYKKIKNFIKDWGEGKAHPQYLIFNRADVNRKLGTITYDNAEDTETSLKAQKDLNASSGNLLSQKQKFSDHSINLIPAMVLQGGFDYTWTQIKF